VMSRGGGTFDRFANVFYLSSVAPGMATAELVAIGDEALAAGVGTRPDQPGGIHASYPAHWGHGLGLGWERPWLVSSEPLTIQGGNGARYRARDHAGASRGRRCRAELDRDRQRR